MQVNGIIAEYNPFHNGHQYHMDKLRTLTHADYTVVVMSGDFTQRGAPALFAKHERAKMALSSGADLVLELPLYYACGSAEYFAGGSIALLDKLHVVDTVGFGSECGQLDKLQKLSDILLAEPVSYRQSLKQYIKQGLSFPVARRQALMECFPDETDLEELLSSPNNILGIEYCKALQDRKSSIQPLTIKREGADYHASKLPTLASHSSFSSALALRTAMATDGKTALTAPDFCQTQMPASACKVLQESWHRQGPIFDESLSALLHYKLLLEQSNGFCSYVDVSEELSDGILNKLPAYQTFSQFAKLLKTKEMTYTRVCRCLLHILLDMKQKHLADYIRQDYVPYARVLGFRRSATPLLHAIKKNSDIPLVTKLADAKNVLTGTAFSMLTEDIRAAHLYQSLLTSQYGVPVENEYTKELIIL